MERGDRRQLDSGDGRGDRLTLSREADVLTDLDPIIRGLMPDLLSYFLGRLGNREDAADALSETMVVLWRKRSHLPSDPTDVRRWAFGVARLVTLSMRRT